jgi:aquaporin Z
MTNSSAGSPAPQQPGLPPGGGRRVRGGLIDRPMAQKYLAELIGTGLLVFFGAGVATVSFGFRGFGSSVAAGILLTGLVFGLVLLGLVAVIGPISSCHVNPAVTLGAFLARRIPLVELLGYWVAQMLGGLLGALLLLWVMHSSPGYSKTKIGLGANGYGSLSLLHSSGGGAFLTEVILTSVFVLVVLAATRKDASAPVAGIVVGLALALVNIMGIPIDGASVNPARSFGPAVLVGGQTLGQLWLFLIAPLVGAVLGVAVYMLFHRVGDDAITAPAGDSSTRTATPRPAAGEENARPAADRPDGPAEPSDQPR